MKRIRVLVSLFLTLLVAFSFVGCKTKDNDEELENESIELSVREFNKYGNVILEVTFDDLKNKNIEPADIITVTIGDASYEIPVGTEYSDVDSGSMICRFDTKDSKVILAINGGNFAQTTSMATKETITEDPGYKWNVSVDKVTLCLKEKNGYRDQYVIRNLQMTYERTDYSSLSDAEYANCRACIPSKISSLFRGTTPLDEGYGRNTYAMSFIEENNVKTIINLTESQEDMEAHETYQGSYYSTCNILNDVMDYQFTSSEFGSKVAIAIRFMLANDGPYYVHCKEGKDRSGIFCAVLECYLGATYEEVKDDYMKTYINFFGVEENSETYQIIVNTNLNKNLANVLNVSDAKTADLKSAALDYYLSIGLTQEELTALSLKLSLTK